ncbi:MAG: PAS domain S-box protein, partial [Gemmatimonadetes bacterium]|nr:PAS domain S-box protein [Gemmatimonadota bacterium]
MSSSTGSTAHAPERLHDAARLSALRGLQLLDSPAEEAFDRITRLASRFLNAPVALISLVDEDRQFFKSCTGLPEPWATWRETPLSHSFCQHVVSTDEPLVIEDAREHPWVRENLAIRDLDVVAYLGIPLRTAAGHVLGSFCVIDSTPRRWADLEVATVRDLAASAMVEIELRAEVMHRQAAEAALRESEGRYRALTDEVLDKSHVGVFVLDAEFRIAWINRQAETWFGLDRQEVLGRSKPELLRRRMPEVMENAEAFIQRVLANYADNRHVERFECHVLPGEGREERWLEHWSQPIVEGIYAGGRTEHYYDITARKRAEEESARLASIVRSSDDAILGIALDNTIASWNAGAERIFGYSAEEAVGQPLFIIAPPERHGEMLALLDALREGRHVDHFETVRRHKNGRPISVSITSSRIMDDSGELVGLSSIVRDITQRARASAERDAAVVRAEEAAGSLRLAEARLAHALQIAATGAWDLDLVGPGSWRFLRHDQIFGYPEGRESWGYEDFLAHVHPDDRPDVDERFRAAIDSNGVWDFTCRIRRDDDGAERWISARGEVVVDEAGRPERMTGVVRDVTDQQLSERSLREARDAAEAANRAKSEFLAIMSHELRTPLNAISGYVDILEMGLHGPVTAAQRDDLRRIQKSQQHLLGLINEVLNYAKLETGAVRYELSDVLVRDALTAAESLVAPQARAKSLALLVTECPPALSARVDGEKLRQILVNLLSNSVKFTEPNGRIEVACSGDDARVTIAIRDTGIGIPADKLESIFEPFVQVRSELTRPHEGTGLGLAISRDLARGMGGD